MLYCIQESILPMSPVAETSVRQVEHNMDALLALLDQFLTLERVKLAIQQSDQDTRSSS